MNNLEQQFKLDVMLALEGRRFKCQAHEDRHTKYIPDVSFSGNYVDGWMEVKFCTRAPATLGSLKHWTKGQEQWLRDMGRAGSGHCYLLVGVGPQDAMRSYLWRWDDLTAVRGMKFADAVRRARIQAGGVPDLAVQFDGLVRIRG